MRYRDNQVCRGVVALDVTKDAALVAAVRDFRDGVAEFAVEIDALSAKVSHQRRLQFNLKRRCSLQDGNEFQGAVWSIQHLRLRYAKECRRASSGDRAYATVFDVFHKNFLSGGRGFSSATSRDPRRMHRCRRARPRDNRLTESSAMSHRAYAWLDGPFFSSTSLDSGRPRRIGPSSSDGGSDRSRPTRTPAKPPMIWRQKEGQLRAV